MFYWDVQCIIAQEKSEKLNKIAKEKMKVKVKTSFSIRPQKSRTNQRFPFIPINIGGQLK